MPRLTLGAFGVFVLRDGFLSVDAREMFGSSAGRGRLTGFEAAGAGRLAISLNCFLIRTGSANVLVDTGAGRTLDGPLGACYGFKRAPGLLDALKAAGLGPGDIDIVINTHLHFDHCGGNTLGEPGREPVPAFPRARYVVQAREWAVALDPPESERESYIPETYEPLRRAGRLRLVEGNAGVVPGVEVRLTPGHTGGHQSVKVDSEGRTLVVLGDLAPTSIHVGLRSVGYDLDPKSLDANKRRVFMEGLPDGWVYGFVHDPVHPFGRVERPGQRFVFRPLDGPAA
jgi:glyoxylase-like metal-dependent hydrolase (beta-lactamase superfamily II)